MKNLFNGSLLFLLFVPLFSCREDPKPVDLLVDGCSGVSFYYLDNQSSRSLSVEFVSQSSLNGKIDPTTAIASKQRLLIGQDARAFGVVPRPTDTFSEVTLYATIDGVKQAVYQQNPVRNELWVKVKQNASNPDCGHYTVSHTLTVTDALLK
ncbi:MAG: hypothetical protein H7Z72_02400 [Bacteroidetes bacterium]|nr:hypothetical protein [Fibrella sp.]